MAKPKNEPPKSKRRKYAPDEVNEHGEYIKIGGSPVPGLTLRHVLRGHTDYITRIAWSPDGKYLASPSADKIIRIWNMNTGECVKALAGHKDVVNDISWASNGQSLASCSADGTVRIWETNTWQFLKLLEGNQEEITCIT
jgi:WD40 repeat protein